MIQPERIRRLNAQPVVRGRYVLYWMQASQRAGCNHALEYAIARANGLGVPVVVAFGVTGDYPEANERHYAFMLEGLACVARDLKKRGIQFVVRHGSPERVAVEAAKGASLLVTDRGYLRHQHAWREHVAGHVGCEAIQVETDAVVPAETVSRKEEFAARTIRTKIHAHLKTFLVPPRETRPKQGSLAMRFNAPDRLDIEDVDGTLERLKIDRSVRRVRDYVGGADEADKLFTAFLHRKLADYATLRNEPSLDCVSHMSPYLHFGQVSPLDLALRVEESAAPRAAKDVFLEELIVRRELSINFVLYNERYDTYGCLPAWARATLRDQAGDRRAHVYSPDEFENAETHDPYWNAAQREMVLTGKMHNYMRMYWGKKIIEWSATPQEAFATALHLNNKYELDGRDPNSFAGVAWCFGKHDRPWTRRPVFGTVRWMNDKGLERKCDIKAYVTKVESMARP
ncbi:MAG: deoxyribodipyrimidine photo-lyase [Planctomycetes bacterium]|nr:deoxyribodipyrimidine photo-lyase [Planctomycetota bacterium]